MQPVSIIVYHNNIFCIIIKILFNFPSLFIRDPEKGRTGSQDLSGGFLRSLLHVVALPSALTTAYSVPARAVSAGAGLFPAPPPWYASGYCHIGKKSDHADKGVQ